ncbi:MAG: hypothetical protein EPO26_07950 [Chloroflexota bacterium]|nr:MAG: hypothetical protein EPO26_07950 [Chloroflexota bacterium]
MVRSVPKGANRVAASRAGKVLSNPHSTKSERSAAATVLSRRSAGKIVKGDSLFRIVGLGKSSTPGGLSTRKH